MKGGICRDLRLNGLLESDQSCSEITGLIILELNILQKKLVPFFAVTPISITLPRSRSATNQIMTDYEQLILTLFWLRHYPVLSLLSTLLRVSEGTITNYLKRCVTVINLALQNIIQWTSDQQFEQYCSKFKPLSKTDIMDFKNLACVVDCSELKVLTPTNQKLQYLYYSSKKKQHSVKFLLIVLLNGTIIYCSDVFPSNFNDQGVWNKLQLRDRFKGKGYGIMGDAGFTFNPKRYDQPDSKIIGYNPFKHYKGQQSLTQEQKIFNKELSKIRVVVENTIAQIKKWRIFKQNLRHFSVLHSNSLDINDVVQVVVNLAAFLIQRTPLHQLIPTTESIEIED